jgi:hypothetical protein
MLSAYLGAHRFGGLGRLPTLHPLGPTLCVHACVAVCVAH